MASYPTQILDAPPQYGFLPGLASGMASGGEKFSNLYAESMMKDMFAKQEMKRKQEAINKFQAAMQQDPNMEMDAVSMDESGNPKWTYKKKKTPESAYEKDPMKMIKQAMGGILPSAQMEQLGQARGIPRQQPMNPYQSAMANESILSPTQQRITPAPPDLMSMVNLPTVPKQNTQLTGPMSAIGEPMDYGRTIQKSLMKDFAPGFTEGQVRRDVMGLSAETPEEKIAAAAAKEKKTFDPITTQTVQKNVKTKEDIDELLKKRKDYEDAGVDVVGILKEFINSGKADPGMIQKIMQFFAED